MRVFLDFEASSLSDRSYPIEVAWVFEDGSAESHLIAPAPNWTDWDAAAQAIHRIDRDRLMREDVGHAVVAARMVEVLSGHALFASAPSWDGKWLSTLLRAAGLPRHRLRLRDTDEALRETATAILHDREPPDRLEENVRDLVTRATATKDPHPGPSRPRRCTGGARYLAPLAGRGAVLCPEPEGAALAIRRRAPRTLHSDGTTTLPFLMTSRTARVARISAT